MRAHGGLAPASRLYYEGCAPPATTGPARGALLMTDTTRPAEKGSLTFFASWLLLHEKADDWICDALRRARETPEDLRQEYQQFLVAVEHEKEGLKGLLAEAFGNEIRQLGFVHRDDARAWHSSLRWRLVRARGSGFRAERAIGRIRASCRCGTASCTSDALSTSCRDRGPPTPNMARVWTLARLKPTIDAPTPGIPPEIRSRSTPRPNRWRVTC